MHARSIALIVVLANMAVAQSIVTSSDKNLAAAPRPLVKQDGTTEETMRGVWRARGYGYLAHVDEKEVRLYNETNSILWQQTDVDASDLLVSVSDDGKQARLTTHRDVPPFVVDRIASMPAGKRVPDEWTPAKIYTAFAETMSERYGFFKERSFNWTDRLNEFEPKISNDMSEMQLFEIISQSLIGLEDAHVQLGATIDGSPQRAMLGTPETLKRGMELFEKQTEFSDFQSYLASRVQALEAGIAEVVLAGKPKQSCEQLTWGTTKNNVGYIHKAILRIADQAK